MEEMKIKEPTAIKVTRESCSSCNDLKLELEKTKSECKALEAKLRSLEAEIMALQAEGVKGAGKIAADVSVDLREEEGVEEDESKVFQLMIENKVLECEKNTAEHEVERWKVKFKDLESRLVEMNGRINCEVTPNVSVAFHGCQSLEKSIAVRSPDLLYNKPELSHTTLSSGGTIDFCSKPDRVRGRLARKRLSFKRTPSKRIAPSTPAGAKPIFHGVINICDSDDESEKEGTEKEVSGTQVKGKAECLTGYVPEGNNHCEGGKSLENSSKETVINEIYQDDVDDIRGVSTPKRKITANVVTSDTESDEDDVPICMLKRMHQKELHPDNMKNSLNSSCPPMVGDVDNTGRTSRRRLITLRQSEGTRNAIPTTEDAEDAESEDAESDSESGSINSFIVDTSEMSDEEDTLDRSGDTSDDDDVNFGEILSRIKRQKDHKFNWQFEADMLSDFGKDTELCMRAVCALYRQQTSEEQFSRSTFVNNRRGFSAIDAERGSTLAVFITCGDPTGDIKRSVQELEEYDSKAVEDCRKLAAWYSKQLFEIYKTKEDPLFLP